MGDRTDWVQIFKRVPGSRGSLRCGFESAAFSMTSFHEFVKAFNGNCARNGLAPFGAPGLPRPFGIVEQFEKPRAQGIRVVGHIAINAIS